MLQEIINIPESLVTPMNKFCEEKHISHEEFFLMAAEKELNQIKQTSPKFADRTAFGLWKGRKIDSVEYVRKLRDEWER